MSDDLVKRLRTLWDADRSIISQTDNWMKERHEAAERIEALEKACKEWSEVSQANYQRAKAAEEKLAEMQVVGDAMAASIEGNYYVAGIAKMWRTIAKIKGEQP